jgi:hypothetical protein
MPLWYMPLSTLVYATFHFGWRGRRASAKKAAAAAAANKAVAAAAAAKESRRRQESLNTTELPSPPLPPSSAAVRTRLLACFQALSVSGARSDGIRVPDAQWHRRLVC